MLGIAQHELSLLLLAPLRQGQHGLQVSAPLPVLQQRPHAVQVCWHHLQHIFRTGPRLLILAR